MFLGTGFERISAAGMPPHSFCSRSVKKLSVRVFGEYQKDEREAMERKQLFLSVSLRGM